MHVLDLDTTPIVVPTRTAAFVDRFGALLVRNRFIPGSPIVRMHEAAERGDLDALRAQLVAMRPDLVQLRAAAEGADTETILKLLERLGVDAGRIADVVQYVALVRAAIAVLNGILGIASVFLNTDTVVGTGIFDTGDGLQVAVVSLTAAVAKENKGFVILDNVEQINQAEVTFTVEEGPPASQVLLAVTLRAFGVGQDDLTAPLQVNSGDGGGSPTALRVDLTPPDAAGLQIVQRSLFARSATTTFTVGLNPGPGAIDYGINGANIALVVEATGVATFPTGTVPLPTVHVVDLGLSV